MSVERMVIAFAGVIFCACAANGSKKPVDPGPDCTPSGIADVSESAELWKPILLSLDGPDASETDSDPNPFLDFRMTARLTGPSKQILLIPGVFAGDGKGGPSGTKWHVHASLDEAGAWDYEVEFRTGPDVAIGDDASIGETVEPHGERGRFCVKGVSSTATGFYASGKPAYVGGHYLHTADGKYWLKGGTNSPENFLGYAGFDNTVNQPGGATDDGLEDGVHHYPEHKADWRDGDPDWNQGNGKAIIGAVNYLADMGINSIYMMLCNLEGDGREVYPYQAPDDLLHFDLSKLGQWDTVFAHAQSRGIALHMVFNEIENENLHDNGTLGVSRKLYYREMIARFAHHPAVFWNLGEESSFGAEKLTLFATYVQNLDAYAHPTTVHTFHDGAESQYAPLLGSPQFTSTSLQITPSTTGTEVEEWRSRSRESGRSWIINVDEPKEAGQGIVGGGGLTQDNVDEYRKLVLWPAYLSGAGGVEWYFAGLPLPPGDDIRAEDFREREPMWKYTTIARKFLLEHLPFFEMEPDDSLLSDESGDAGQVFAKKDDVYALYLPNASDTGTLDLSGATGSFNQSWFNPRTGEFEGNAKTVSGGSPLVLGSAPDAADDDWVVLIER
ncbi:MAG: DUF5060 domain-containing protein [Myxococcales bacterium]|nr:DUF5060 domain-containing protein [Myxococcales bacterium]MCB9708196.1 DUF5060 domain-containing protein [Myxococcales bacterium]